MYPSRHPIAVKTSPRRSFFAVHRRGTRSRPPARRSPPESAGGGGRRSARSDQAARPGRSRRGQPVAAAEELVRYPPALLQLLEHREREQREVDLLARLVEDATLALADGSLLEERQHRHSELRDPVGALRVGSGSSTTSIDVEIRPPVRWYLRRAREPTTNSANVSGRSSAQSVTAVFDQIHPCVYICEDALVDVQHVTARFTPLSESSPARDALSSSGSIAFV